MSQSVQLGGVGYSIPDVLDSEWGQSLTDYLVAIPDAVLQTAGGAFTLLADVNFGGTAGTVSLYYKSRSSNISTTGILRLASTDTIGWRNNANSDNITLSKNVSDELLWNATKVLLSGAVVNADINAAAAIAYSKLNLATSIVNADVAVAAAIARTKLANGTASHVLINDGSGVMSSEATLAKSRGGAGADMSSVTFPSTGTIVTRDASETLTNKTLTSPVLTSPTITGYSQPITSVQTSTYAATNADYAILCDSSGGAFDVDLPTAVGNEGLQLFIKKVDSTFATANAITIDPDGTETIDGAASTTLNTQNESLLIISDGANWRILERKIPSVWTAWTPTGSWVNVNTIYTGFWRRTGDSIEYQIKVATGAGTTAASLTINLLSGLTIDTAKMVATTAADIIGFCQIRETGVTILEACIRYSTTSVIAIGTLDDTADGIASTSSVTNTSPITFAATDYVTVHSLILPITGWKG